ncbi:MAG: hypothetical protein PHU78_09580, partial [Heliobacteriaceae bacterium]|nr:hypothetical protein [Heliobacteriaceae bacterium]
MSKMVSTPNYEMAVNLLATIQILQQIFVNSLPGRLVKMIIALLAGLNQVWLTSRFYRFLEQLSHLAAISFTGRFLGADPWSRLQTQTGASLFLRLWRQAARPLNAARRAWTTWLAKQAGSSITVAILSHLACPEGWQLSGIVRAGLAFGLGLGLGLTLYGLLTPVTALLPFAILGAYLLWRDTPATIQAVWQDSLPGKAVTALLAEADETPPPAPAIAPALTGAARYLMYGLLLLFGLFTGYLWHRFQTPYVLALPVALALVQLIILRPAAGLWAVAFYAEIDWFSRYKCQAFGLPSWWDEALLVLMVFAVAARWLTSRSFTWRSHPTLFPLTAFIAIMVALFLIDDHYLRISVPLEGFRVVVQHLLWFYLVVQLVRSQPQAKVLLTGFV